MKEEMLTARQFARRFGLNERTMQTLAKQGRVEGRELIGPYYVAPLSAWQKAVEQKRSRGRPRKKEAPGTS